MPKVILEAQDKPNLFLTADYDSESWRLTEMVVAIVESYLEGREDVLAVSSTRVRDVVDLSEQLDIAFTTDLTDPTEVFSFIEVRDRADKVGRNYIQEIMGKRVSLGIDSCKVVSTKEFTRDARLLATHQGIPLRLLVPEPENARWYLPDTMQIHRKLSRIDKCAALVRVGKLSVEVQGGKMEFLAPTTEPDVYSPVSVSKVFEVEVAQHPEFDDRLFSRVPADGEFHQALPITVEYSSSVLYMRVEDVRRDIDEETENDVCPVEGVRFFVSVSKLPLIGRVVKRYQYLDAVSREKLSDLVLADFQAGGRGFYLCLLRCKWEGGSCQVGGVFFE